MSSASHHSIEPAAGKQVRRSDALESWLTDIRINLNHDPPDWLDAVVDPEDPATAPPTVPPVGRHRAAD
jgi:hypothetical protein